MTVGAVAVPRGRAMSVLIHADTKIGKSTFGNTTPAPRLLLDVEMAYRFLPGHKVFWDPMREAPPRWDGSWETCVVVTRDYMTFTRAMEWLASGQHDFISVVLDSVSELQSRCKDNLAADGRMSIQLWGDLLNAMDRQLRALRDLTEHPTRPLQAVVLTAMTQMRDGKWRPYVQGQLQVKAPYFFDVIGYMYVEAVQDPNDPTAPAQPVRKMLVTPHAQFEAGERVQGRLGGSVVENPNMTEMLNMVFGPLPTEGVTQ